MRGLSWALVLSASAGILAQGQTRKFTCADCHAREAASQPGTPMGQALLTSQSRGRLTFQFGKFSYLVEGNIYTVSDGQRRLSLPIRWIFGAGAQTYVLTRDGNYFESLVSYYPATGGLDLTVGDAALNPQTVEEAIGRKLETPVVTACFNCHSTHALTGRKLDLQALTPGLTCERCHSDTQPHLKSFSKPEKLGAKSAEAMANFCGQCHRTWETVVRNNWRGPMNARFQPYRLTNSKCFNGTDARIRCVACHNPHEDLVSEPAAYDAKCLACHDSSQKACPVAKERCTTCHMPKIPLPGGHQIFTDHQIRIVKAGEGYPN